MHKILKDNYAVKDGVEKQNLRGFVRMTDLNTGKIIFAKHNTIVSSGRNSVYAWSVKNMLPSSIITSKLTSLSFNKFYKIIFGEGKSITTVGAFNDVSSLKRIYDANYGLLSNGDYFPYEYTIDESNTIIDPEARYIKISLEVSKKDNVQSTYNLSELSISLKEYNSDGTRRTGSDGALTDNAYYESVYDTTQYSDGDQQSETNNEADLIFSRISFDPIPVGADSKFLMDYYIYF